MHAVKDLSFQIRRGTTLGLVGESGSGKSTVAAALTGLVEPDGGSAPWTGIDVFGVRGAAEKALRRRISLVFQDPFSSLNPRVRGGHGDRGAAARCTGSRKAKVPAGNAWQSCSSSSGCPRRSRRVTRTSCPAGSVSG